MKLWGYAAVGLIVLGALMVTGIFAFLPQCGLGFNFIIISGCAYPITIFGLNPNLVAGMVLIGSGIALGAYVHFEAEA